MIMHNYKSFLGKAISWFCQIFFFLGDVIKPKNFYNHFPIFVCLIGALVFFNGTFAFAENYYVDPKNGNINNSGDADNPWDTLEQVFRQRKTIAAGDTLFLFNGYHGSPNIRGNNDEIVVIKPLDNHQPELKSVTFSSANKWSLSGVTISPETAAEYEKSTLVTINSTASEIIVENCFCYSVKDNSSWTSTDWSSNSCSGASISGDYNVLRNNHFLNVKHGILVESSAEHNLIDNNIVENFAADGMRGIGSYNTFQYNTVKNCYDVDDNHDDGFQSYSYGSDGVGKTTVYGIVLRGNIIINYTDPHQRFRGTLQGFGCFDGMFEDWIVENNVVITDHWHGISLFGAKNCKVVNNTVVDQNTSTPGPPWIQITAHKDGTKSTNNIVKNNLTTSLSNDTNIGQVGYNMIISNYDAFFVDYQNFDLRLKEGCRAIDAGTNEDAPEIDILGNARPQGQRVDIGAYEYTESTGVQRSHQLVPENFFKNYPNPFNQTTCINYQIQESNIVELSVYNLVGERIATLVNERQSAGEYNVQFDAFDLTSGLYFYKIQAGGFELIGKMVLQK